MIKNQHLFVTSALYIHVEILQVGTSRYHLEWAKNEST